MPDDLYLIAHKVRGEAAFDIAIRLPELDEDGEEAWIIPTSGHRAYPYWISPIYQCDHTSYLIEGIEINIGEIPPAIPDHYTTSSKPEPGLVSSLLDRLGLRKPKTPLQRRV